MKLYAEPLTFGLLLVLGTLFVTDRIDRKSEEKRRKEPPPEIKYYNIYECEKGKQRTAKTCKLSKRRVDANSL